MLALWEAVEVGVALLHGEEEVTLEGPVEAEADWAALREGESLGEGEREGWRLGEDDSE
jgi:hypothetical protein